MKEDLEKLIEIATSPRSDQSKQSLYPIPSDVGAFEGFLKKYDRPTKLIPHVEPGEDPIANKVHPSGPIDKSCPECEGQLHQSHTVGVINVGAERMGDWWVGLYERAPYSYVIQYCEKCNWTESEKLEHTNVGGK